jgi:hypothetical protein
MTPPRRNIDREGREWAEPSGKIYMTAGTCSLCHERLVPSASLVRRDGWQYFYCEKSGCPNMIGRKVDVENRTKIGRWR